MNENTAVIDEDLPVAEVTDHDGPGVLPGRYAGPDKRISTGPTPQQQADALARSEADRLAGQICAAAAVSAQASCALLELVGDFVASDAIRFWTDVKSVAHWLSWSCSMTLSVAREHVRVARALREMPTVLVEFRAGRLSYSKVREISRVVDVVDEAKLCDLARTATAAQLATMISAFRSCDGGRIQQQNQRKVTWGERVEGMIDIRARLPKEEAAVIIAALQTARDQFGAPPAKPSAFAHGDATTSTSEPSPKYESSTHSSSHSELPSHSAPATLSAASSAVETRPVQSEDAGEPAPGVGMYTLADAFVDVARVFLDTAPEDRSGEDRTLVVVHVSTDVLAGATASKPGAPGPAGSHSEASDPIAPHAAAPEALAPGRMTAEHEAKDVPAGTSLAANVAYVEGLGPIEGGTAARLACDNPVLGAVVTPDNDVLTLGRTRRLVSRAQRRALMIRDRMCQFPGCAQTRHLKAHHILSWAAGGLTDLPNLILLCQWHHTAVHEGGLAISGLPGHWRFLLPDGTEARRWHDDQGLAAQLSFQLAGQFDRARDRVAAVDSFQHPDAETIRPRWAGEPFNVHDCVQALFAMRRPEQPVDQAAA